MLITEIRLQKRNKKRYSIFIDNHYRMSVGVTTLCRLNLKQGDEVNEQYLDKIVGEEEKRYIRERIERILAYRDRSPAELISRMLRLGFERELVKEIVQEYVDQKILDEERLVKSFIADYSKLNLKGNIYIRRQLLAKGIDRQLIDRHLRERDELAVAQQFLKRRQSKEKGMDKAHVLRLLASRGFSSSVIYEVANEEF